MESPLEVTEQVVREVAELAQLQLDEAEIQALVRGMTNILELADQMQSVDTTGVEPVSNPLDATQQMRPDVVTEENQRDLFQSVAPSVEDGLYLVPRVVE